MRAGALSAAWNLAGIRGEVSRKEEVVPKIEARSSPLSWSQTFADEQIRGLVRRVFAPSHNPAIQQVVLAAIEPETDVRGLCQWMAEVLANEKRCEVGLFDPSDACAPDGNDGNHELREQHARQCAPIRQFATAVSGNRCAMSMQGNHAESLDGQSLCRYMAELRREFEYSIVAAPPAAVSSQALEMARFADGIILVLSAQRTRRVAALKIRNALAQVRLLGTILSDREFPMPTGIYRRL